MRRFLVCFTTPVEGGWSTAYSDAWAIVRDADDGAMPYGWQPTEIGGLPVQEVKWIIPLDLAERVTLISGEHDAEVQLPGDGSAVIVNDEAFPDRQDDMPEDEKDGTAFG